MVPIKETLYLALGEALVSAVTVGVFLLLKKYDSAVLLGAILGSTVMILNFLFLSISINRAIDRALENAPKSIAERLNAEKDGEGGFSGSELPGGSKSDTVAAETIADDGNEENEDADEQPDEAEIFAKEYSLSVQNSARLSYILRTLSMVAVLLLAFLLSDVFNVIAAVIPMICFRPILMIENYFRSRKAK